MKHYIFLSMCLWMIGTTSLQADPPYLAAETMVRTTIYGEDSIFRLYRYSARGFTAAIVDSPLHHERHTTSTAACDSVGRIVEVHSYRNLLTMSARYYWTGEQEVRFAIRDTGGVLQDTGFMRAHGKIRLVRLPQSEEAMLPTTAERNRIVIVADSTEIFNSNGAHVITHYWKFDTADLDTVWFYRLAGADKQEWVESYTNSFRPDGCIRARFPALTGPCSFYFFSDSPVAALPFSEMHRDAVNYPIPCGKRISGTPEHFILNGQKVFRAGIPSTANGYFIGRSGDVIHREIIIR